MEQAIKIEGLRKSYKETVALDGLSLTMPAASLTGFLGPNGAGKTTTFRALLGLTRPDAGRMEILGMEVGTDTHRIVKRLGAIVEEPGLVKGLNGRDNLRVAAHTLGKGHEKVEELLDFVGLAGDAGRRIDGYSKGMRQRLALAAALLGGPELLFLDEPLDGLDPAGQSQIRQQLRDLVARGKTVVVSSHNLGDVEAIADNIVVINHGRLVTSGSLDQLLGSRRGNEFRVSISTPVEARIALEAGGFPVTVDGTDLVVGGDDGAAIIRTLADAGLYPSEVVRRAVKLEEVFLELTEPS
jgi:ABC-2 type transport system ATP-binding protein